MEMVACPHLLKQEEKDSEKRATDRDEDKERGGEDGGKTERGGKGRREQSYKTLCENQAAHENCTNECTAKDSRSSDGRNDESSATNSYTEVINGLS